MKLKYSRQRQAIQQYLMQTTTHPTADTVYHEVKKIYPNISLGTVYRNLNLLVEQGEILKLSYENTPDRFDGNPLPHYHFLCEQCKCIRDLSIESIDHINTIANANFDGIIHGHLTYFYGLCPECMQHLEEK